MNRYYLMASNALYLRLLDRLVKTPPHSFENRVIVNYLAVGD